MTKNEQDAYPVLAALETALEPYMTHGDQGLIDNAIRAIVRGRRRLAKAYSVILAQHSRWSRVQWREELAVFRDGFDRRTAYIEIANVRARGFALLAWFARRGYAA